MMMVAPPMMPPPPPPESDKHIRALTSMPYDGFMSWLGKGAGKRPHPTVYRTVRAAGARGIGLAMLKEQLDKIPTVAAVAARGVSGVQKLHLASYVSHFTHVERVFRQRDNPVRVWEPLRLRIAAPAAWSPSSPSPVGTKATVAHAPPQSGVQPAPQLIPSQLSFQRKKGANREAATPAVLFR